MSDGVAALVPMRHSSVRVPGKNYRPLGGVPLYHHVIRTLLHCSSITSIVIDTDSPTIADDCQQMFPSVRLVERAEHLRGDDVPMTEVLRETIEHVPADLYLQTHSTNPFLKPATIERALAAWYASPHARDSLFSVTRLQARLWDSVGRPLNHNPWLLLRTQDLPPVFLENSNFYLFTADLLRTSGRRTGDRPIMFEVDPLESLDIDDEGAFQLAEAMLQSGAQVR